MRQRFNRVVDWFIRALGTPSALGLAALTIVVWGLTGPVFGFSDTWQLVINTATTIVTFLMVFVIQNAHNRDTKAVHIKLDELITSIDGARNHLVMAEMQTEEEQDREIRRLVRVARKAAKSPTRAAVAEVVEMAEDAVEASQRAEAEKRARSPLARPNRAAGGIKAGVTKTPAAKSRAPRAQRNRSCP